ncbi:MAG: putative DNA-binding domain-containing protein [Terracidiphilus sp.]
MSAHPNAPTNHSPMDLAQLQREMAAAVMQPLTPDENMRSTAPDGRPMAKVAESFIAPNSRLTAFERLEIYNRQYWYRVLGALAEDFPALRAVIGGPRFEALSIAYLAEHPSRSFTLRNLGSKLPAWLAAHPEHTGRRHRLAVDMAKMEWAFVEAFDAAELAPLTQRQIAALQGDSRLALQPYLQLIALHYPADNLVIELHRREKRQASEAGVAHENDDGVQAAVPRLRPRPIWLAVHRVDLSVYYRRIGREEFQTLMALHSGSALADALEAGFAGSRIPEHKRAEHVQEWFGNWAELGWICQG